MSQTTDSPAAQGSLRPVPFPPCQRRYLYLTAGLTGAAVMIVEILGAKMLAPYVGTSHFVWTAQIAVTMVALALGYFMGGRMADRSQRLGPLYAAIALAALYLAGTVWVVQPLAYWSLQFKLPLGTLIASTGLYFVPLALLAMVGPYLVRVLAVSLTGVGGTVGRLTALSTLGSFVGTVLIGYVLIPFLPNSVTMHLTAGLLLLISAVYFIFWQRRAGGTAVVLVAGAALCTLGVARPPHARFGAVNEVYFGNSNFGQMQVLETLDKNRRFYINDYLTQNTYDVSRKQSLSLFTYMLHGLARAYTPQVQEVLCIGMGVGIVPMQFAREGARVDVVEINPAVVPVARQFFDCDPSSFNLVIDDGRHFLNQASRAHYDTVILDAFLGDASPSHLMTREAFQAVASTLKPEGTLVINSFGRLTPGRDFFATSLARTLGSVFRQVRLHQTGNGNFFFVASNQQELRILYPISLDLVHPEKREEVRLAAETVTQVDVARGQVLTDNYNPVDFYDAENREELRRNLAMGMKSD